ncbi:MAG: hypothetical protein LUF86_02675 [Clostridiales bacterium]|nr:hypothetical protein [Clostridiales bacterium]
MDMKFTDKLNAAMGRVSGSGDALMNLFGLPTDGQYDMAVISPMWKPEDVLANQPVETVFQRETNTLATYLLRCGEKQILWLHIGPCAGNVMDACLGLSCTKCDKILFLGLCSTMKDDLTAGDLVVPNKAISGTGATRYLQDALGGDDTFGKERRTPPKGILWLSKAAIKAEAKLNTRTVFSTDSILGALIHQPEVEAIGADVVDMEATAFTRCLSLMERTGTALLVVSGKLGEDRLSRPTPEAETALNHTVEETLGEIIINLAK